MNETVCLWRTFYQAIVSWPYNRSLGWISNIRVQYGPFEIGPLYKIVSVSSTRRCLWQMKIRRQPHSTAKSMFWCCGRWVRTPVLMLRQNPRYGVMRKHTGNFGGHPVPIRRRRSKNHETRVEGWTEVVKPLLHHFRPRSTLPVGWAKARPNSR